MTSQSSAYRRWGCVHDQIPDHVVCVAHFGDRIGQAGRVHRSMRHGVAARANDQSLIIV